jgi:hypothetical protein
MPRPKKILSEEEQRKLDNRKKVRAILLRLLGHVDAFKINYVIETSILKSWVKKYGFEFVEQFNLPDFLSEVESLRPLTGSWGIQHIKEMYNLWEFNKKKSAEIVELTPVKIGADSQIITKPKNLKSFLNS